MNRLLKLIVFSTSRSFLQNVVENPFQLQIPATIEELQGVVADQSEVSQSLVSAVQQQSALRPAVSRGNI